jgi:hypothetical protein
MRPDKPIKLGRRDSARALRRSLARIQDATLAGRIPLDVAGVLTAQYRVLLEALKVELGEQRLGQLWRDLDEIRQLRPLPPQVVNPYLTVVNGAAVPAREPLESLPARGAR